MTKEYLKLEAKNYAKRKFDYEEQEYLQCIIAQIYYDGAEPREKRIDELEAQIEKMKCCGNCKHQGVDCEWFTNHKQPCTNLNKWQLRR